MNELVLKHFQYILQRHQTSILSILSSSVIGLTGILPVLTIQLNDDKYSKKRNKKLNLMSSFGVGSLLGEVFLHLLPEAVQLSLNTFTSPHLAYHHIGVWILVGILAFIIIEILSNCQIKEVFSLLHSTDFITRNEMKSIETIGYLNLIANGFDNFSHGLAVSTSFKTDFKIGFLTTFAIIIHEIPHEFIDFAILLKSGFTKWEAMRAQLLTASVGVGGALFAIWFDCNVDMIEIWVLPLICGTFINIALVSLLPQLLLESDIRQSIHQLFMIGLGIGVMAIVNYF